MKKLPPLLFIWLFVGCNISDFDIDSIEKPQIQGSWGFPLGEASYTMRELIEEINDSNLELSEDSTSLIFLSYRDSATFDSGGEIVNIGTISNSANVRLPVTPPVPSSTIISVQDTVQFQYEPDNRENLDSLFYDQGELAFNISTTLDRNISYEVTVINTVNPSEQPVTFTGNVHPSSAQSEIRSLTNHKTFFDEDASGNNLMNILVNLNIPLSTGGQIGSDETVSISLDYQNQTFSAIYGKFGRDTLNIGNEVINMSFFDDIGEAGFGFGNPTMTFTVSNSFGVDLGVLFGGLYALEEPGAADTTFLTGPVTEVPQIIPGAALAGETSVNTIELNTTNSSIRQLLDGSPSSMGFNITAISNPEDTTTSNFLLNDSRINTTIEVTLPLEIQLRDVEHQVNFNLRGGQKLKGADSLILHLVTINELPFSATADLEIVDENDSVLFIAAENVVLATPFFNSQQVVEDPKKNIEDIVINSTGVAALQTGSRMIMRMRLNTPKSLDYVKVLADYSIQVKASIVGALNVDN